jgi:hypothetical protein
MKRFIGLLLTGTGAVGAVWGGYQALVGQTSNIITINNFSVSALTVGLTGVVVLTVGLLWMRD